MKFENILIQVSNTMKLRGFTYDTKKTYNYNISKYLLYLNKKSALPCEMSAKSYLLDLISKGYGSSSVRIVSASILFLLKDVLKQKVTYIDIPKPKKKKLLPQVLSKEEINLILNNIKNPKHNLMISFLYSTGIRLSELINVKRSDIQMDRNIVFVSGGKGQKDRQTILSSKVKEKISSYLCKNDFKTKYLFESAMGKKYSKASVQKIVSIASRELNKKVTPHTFRHSFATHLLESGIDIRFIQKLLGHTNLETTSIYAQVASNRLGEIKSPFDNL